MMKSFDLDQGENLCAGDIDVIKDAFENCPDAIRNQHYLSTMIYARQLQMCGKQNELKQCLNQLDRNEMGVRFPPLRVLP